MCTHTCVCVCIVYTHENQAGQLPPKKLRRNLSKLGTETTETMKIKVKINKPENKSTIQRPTTSKVNAMKALIKLINLSTGDVNQEKEREGQNCSIGMENEDVPASSIDPRD